MDRPVSEAARRERSRRHRTRRQQNAKVGPHAGEALDQRQNGIGLADTRGMKPDERTLGPCDAGLSIPLTHARRVFFPLTRPH